MDYTYLTARELQVISEVIKGETQREIAECLGVRPATIKVHLRNVYKKLDGVDSMRKLMRWHTIAVLRGML